MAAWEFISHVRNGAAIANLADLGSRKISLYLNQPGDVTGVLDLFSPRADRSVLQPGVHELKIYRDGVQVETVFQLATAVPELNDEGGGALQLSWLGVSSYLSDLFVGPAYNVASAAQNTVAWSVINTAQGKTNANYGITDGTHTAAQPSKTFDAEEERDAKEAVTSIGDRASGFDWRISTDRTFQTWYPQRGDYLAESVIFQHGMNCTIGNLAEDASPGAIVNAVKVKIGNNASVTVQDATSQAIYGRREGVATLPDEYSATVATQYGNAIIATRAYPSIIPVIQVDVDHPTYSFGTPWLGDVVRVIADVGMYARYDDDYRIVAVHIEIDDEGKESVAFELNAA